MKSRIGPALVLLAILAGGGWFLRNEFGSHQGEETHEPHAEGALTERPTSVKLPEDKLVAAGIATTSVERRQLRDVRTVPGRIQYDDTRHIEVKLPTEGILTEVRIKPGDVVESGAVLAILSSPEVGNARADVLKCQTELALAERQYEWHNGICQGLKRLVNAVESKQDASAIVADMGSISLGASREQVMTAYSRFRLAETMMSNVNALNESGAVSLAVVQQRQSELNSAEAALKAITEQSMFEADRECREAEAMVQDAHRRLRISEQHLTTLLGYSEAAPEATDMQQLSHVEIRAPFAGTIETKNYSTQERVSHGDSLCVLANTEQMWVAADIREREWGALRLRAGETIEVTAPGLPGEVMQATVAFLGRQVDPNTNAVPLVASIPNVQGLLRPGQFCRVALPVATARDVLAVPDSALLEHEAAQFVFVQEQPNEFRRVDVTVGLSDAGWTEVSGIDVGTPVVSQGAFYLKSELLLEGEE
ncbi:MAG: efflux RND transporter periplasmic adaptor subunit [Planctomycetaceae bacterium]|nr:efflux RND transporter periplasmic adaptor subunit [Planctomycetaceae bacterium]